MRIFNLFGKKGEENKSMIVPLQAVEPAEAKGMVKSVDVEKSSDSNGVKPMTGANDKPMTISYATRWPIDVVYGYLHKNYEQKGFEDAMVNSDLAFKDMNLNLIKNKILMVFREINLNYDVMEQKLQTSIDNSNAAGLLTTVTELGKTMKLINSHKEELRQLEANFRNGVNEASTPLLSYECGFLRGVATFALGGAPAPTGSIGMATVLKKKAFATA